VERGRNLGASGMTGMTERARAALPAGGSRTGEPYQTFSRQQGMSGEPLPIQDREMELSADDAEERRWDEVINPRLGPPFIRAWCR